MAYLRDSSISALETTQDLESMAFIKARETFKIMHQIAQIEKNWLQEILDY